MYTVTNIKEGIDVEKEDRKSSEGMKFQFFQVIRPQPSL